MLGIEAALTAEQAEANLGSLQDYISSDPDLSKTRYRVWLWEMLEKQGAQVEYYDPHVPVIRPSREHAQFAGRKSAELTSETVSSFDLVLVATHHKAVDWPLIAQNARLVVDSRNALSTAMKGKPNYFKA